MFLEAAIESRSAQPVAFLRAERKEAADTRATGCQHALEERQRCDAIDVVVAIKDNSFAHRDGVADTIDRLLHLGKEKGVCQLSQSGLEEVRGNIEIAGAVANQDPRKKLRNTQVPAQAADCDIAVGVREDPTAVHFATLGLFSRMAIPTRRGLAIDDSRVSRLGISARSKRSDHLRGKPGPFPALFVFKVDVSVDPFVLVRAQDFRPAGDIDCGVVFAPQAQVTEVGRRDDGRAELFALSDAKRRIVRAKALENLIVEP